MNFPKEFQPITIEHKEKYEQYFNACPAPNADITFINLWAWGEELGICLNFTENLCWICQTKPYIKYWYPVGDWRSVNWLSIDELQQGISLINVPYALADILKSFFKEHIEIIDERDQWEYLYRKQIMAGLKGRIFHAHKNRCNQFCRLYGIDYRILDSGYPKEEFITLLEKWYEEKKTIASQSLISEKKSLTRLLSRTEYFPRLHITALFVYNQMTAFSIAEKINTMMIVHFQKALTQFAGAYQTISKKDAEHYPSDIEIINWEQDLGNQGLRHHKMMYQPFDFIRKCQVIIR